MLKSVEALASLKLTLAAIALLTLSALWASYAVIPAPWIVGGPFALLVTNLLAAVVANPVFRRQTPLLVFHISLVFVVALTALGKLVYLEGQVEVTEGTEFDVKLAGYERGPWHWFRLDRVRFTNEGFTIDFAPGGKRGKTYNNVAWPGPDGEKITKAIGDQVPLDIGGYRFYTTSNKGFAPIFTWIPKGGSPPMTGSVHLPSYPKHRKEQALPWSIPSTDVKIFAMLMLGEEVIDPGKASRFQVPADHHVIVRAGDDTMKMRPGDRFDLPGGALVYDELRTWMGYSIHSDWTLPWLFASCAVAAASAGWYFWSKFSASPWMKGKDMEKVGD